jgi:hypothetical protein
MPCNEAWKKHNFVIFQVPLQGWGNRIRTLASSYLLAVLSERVFLVDWTTPTPLDKLITPPLQWSLQEYLARCPTSQLQSLSTLSREVREVLVSNGRYTPNGVSPLWRILERKNVKIHFSKKKVLSVVGYSAFTRAFTANPYHRLQMSAFRNVDDPLEVLFPYLFGKPSQELEQIIEPFAQEFKNHYIVGLQMRFGAHDNYFVYPENSVVGGHQVSREVAEAYTRGSIADKAQIFFKCARRMVDENQKVKVFLATDNSEVVQLAKQTFGNKLLFLEGGLAHSGFTRLVYRTYWSTFGYTAIQRSGTVRMIVPFDVTVVCSKPHTLAPIEMTNW